MFAAAAHFTPTPRPVCYNPPIVGRAILPNAAYFLRRKKGRFEIFVDCVAANAVCRRLFARSSSFEKRIRTRRVAQALGSRRLYVRVAKSMRHWALSPANRFFGEKGRAKRDGRIFPLCRLPHLYRASASNTAPRFLAITAR